MRAGFFHRISAGVRASRSANADLNRRAEDAALRDAEFAVFWHAMRLTFLQ